VKVETEREKEAAKRKKSTLLERICIMFITIHWILFLSLSLTSFSSQVFASVLICGAQRKAETISSQLYLPPLLLPSMDKKLAKLVFLNDFPPEKKLTFLKQLTSHSIELLALLLLLSVCVSMAFIAGIRLKVVFLISPTYTSFCTYQHLKIKAG
jgi:hypothetical protein